MIKTTKIVYWYLSLPRVEEQWVSMQLSTSRHKLKLAVAVNDCLEPDMGSIFLFGSSIYNSFQFMKEGKLEDYKEVWKGFENYKVPLSAVTFENARKDLLELGFKYLEEAVPHLANVRNQEGVNSINNIRMLMPSSISRNFCEMGGCVRSRYEKVIKKRVDSFVISPRFISVPFGGMTRQMRELTPKK